MTFLGLVLSLQFLYGTDIIIRFLNSHPKNIIFYENTGKNGTSFSYWVDMMGMDKNDFYFWPQSAAIN